MNLPGFTGRCLEGTAAELSRLLQASAKAVTDGSAGVLSSVHSFELNIPHCLFFSQNPRESNLIIAIGRHDKTRRVKNLTHSHWSFFLSKILKVF